MVVFKPFVQKDLYQLGSTGITVTYKGALLAFLADTQASHLVGGLKKSLSLAYRMCRVCMATSNTFKVKFISSEFPLKAMRTHKSQCDSLTGPHNSKVYGIFLKYLLDVKHFSMCDWGLPHVMHILFEGVVQ